MRCLVTGASGFLGSWLVRQLLAEGDEVVAVVRSATVPPRLIGVDGNLRFAHADLASISTISSSIHIFRPETVFHLAWWGGNSSSFVNDPGQVYTNTQGTLDLLRIAHEAGAASFLFFGTSVEYGNYSVPVRETDPTTPKNLYGTAKNALMQLTQALAAQWQMRFCGIRPFWTYGPMDDELRMIPSVTRQLLQGNKPKVTAGEQLWDFLYVEDAARAITALGHNPQASGIFNLGSGAPVPLKQVIATIRDLVDPALEIGFGEIPYAPGQIMHLEADISRLRQATGWSSSVSLEEGLRRTVDWYKQKDATAHGQ